MSIGIRGNGAATGVPTLEAAGAFIPVGAASPHPMSPRGVRAGDPPEPGERPEGRPSRTLGVGDVAHIPAGSPHEVVPTDGDTTSIQVFSPPLARTHVRALHRPNTLCLTPRGL